MALGAFAAALTGCTPGEAVSTAPTAAGSTAPTGATSYAAPSVSAASPSAPATPTATPTGRACFEGDYRVTSFRTSGASALSGRGGALDLTFDGGAYTMTSAGEPVTLTSGQDTLRLVVDGNVKGRFAGSGKNAVFTQDSADGTASVTGSGGRQDLGMKEVGALVVPQGAVTATCAKNRATFTSSTATIEMRRR